MRKLFSYCSVAGCFKTLKVFATSGTHCLATLHLPLPARLMMLSVTLPSYPPASRAIRASPRRQTGQIVCRGSKKDSNVFTVGLVAVLTEGLRFVGVGKDRYQEMATSVPSSKRLRRGDINGLMKRIRRDFDMNAYIVTGVIDDGIYDEDCFFADPTVAFSGLALWKRNLQLLVPFLISPSVDLLSIKKLGRDDDGADVLLSEWKLETTLSLPWRPLISVLGKTRYTLGEDSKIVKHVESWDVSGTEAVLQIFRPGPKDR